MHAKVIEVKIECHLIRIPHGNGRKVKYLILLGYVLRECRFENLI